MKNLKKIIKENGYKYSDIADELGISKQKMRYRLEAFNRGRNNFSKVEMKKIANFINLDVNIFNFF